MDFLVSKNKQKFAPERRSSKSSIAAFVTVSRRFGGFLLEDGEMTVTQTPLNPSPLPPEEALSGADQRALDLLIEMALEQGQEVRVAA